MTVEGRSAVATRRDQLILIVAFSGSVAIPLWQHHYEWLLYPVGLSASWIWRVTRPPTVVSAAGISRPWHRRRFVEWSEVESVAAPEPGRPGCALNLVSGKSLRLADIPADKTTLVAAAGGKRVAAPPTLARRPSPPNRPKTDMEIAADVTRRAELLAIQRRELAIESIWLRGDRR